MLHICIDDLTINGADNGLSPGKCKAIIRTSAGILLIGPLGTNFSEILIAILTFSFKKMRLKVSSAKWRPFCLGHNVLTLNVRGPSYLGLTRSISWLLMPWLLTSATMILTMWNRQVLVLFKEGFLSASYQCGEMTQNVNICLCYL